MKRAARNLFTPQAGTHAFVVLFPKARPTGQAFPPLPPRPDQVGSQSTRRPSGTVSGKSFAALWNTAHAMLHNPKGKMPEGPAKQAWFERQLRSAVSIEGKVPAEDVDRFLAEFVKPDWTGFLARNDVGSEF